MIHVSSDPGELAEARRPVTAADRQALLRGGMKPCWQAIEAGLATFSYVDSSPFTVEGMREDPEAAKAWLLANLDGGGNQRQKCTRVALLCLLDPLLGWPHFEALERQGRRVSFGENRIPLPNQPYLEWFQARIHSSESAIAKAALQGLPAVLDRAEVEAIYRRLVDDPDYPHRIMVVGLLYKRPLDNPREAVDHLFDLLAKIDESQKKALLFKIQNLDDPAYHHILCERLFTYMEQHPEERGPCLLEAGNLVDQPRFTAWVRPLLQQLQPVNQDDWTWITNLVLHLGEDAVPHLVPLLDQDDWFTIVYALGLVAAGSRRDDLVELLENKRGEAENPWWEMIVLTAMAQIGGDRADALVIPHLDNRDIRDKEGILWSLQGWTDMDLLAKCIEADLLEDVPDPFTVRRLVMADFFHGYDRLLTLLEGLEGRAVMLRCDAGICPVPHDELVARMATVSRGLFQAQHIKQVAVPGSSDYRVSFIHQGRVYRVDVESTNDYYNYPPVLEAVNQALADAGVEERFLMPIAFDCAAGLILGKEYKVFSLLDDIGLKPVYDPVGGLQIHQWIQKKVKQRIGR